MASLDRREVRLNVYDLNENANSWLGGVGFGAYHTGVEVGGYEYSFADGGVYKCSPRSAPPPAKFRETIVLGFHSGTANDVSQVVRELREDFPPRTYDLLSKNCNAFSNAFSVRLIGVELPKWVNRLAGVGGFFQSLGVNVKQSLEGGGAGDPSSSSTPRAKPAAATADRSKKKELTDKQKELLGKMKEVAK